MAKRRQNTILVKVPGPEESQEGQDSGSEASDSVSNGEQSGGVQNGQNVTLITLNSEGTPPCCWLIYTQKHPCVLYHCCMCPFYLMTWRHELIDYIQIPVDWRTSPHAHIRQCTSKYSQYLSGRQIFLQSLSSIITDWVTVRKVKDLLVSKSYFFLAERIISYLWVILFTVRQQKHKPVVNTMMSSFFWLLSTNRIMSTI